MRIIIDQVEEPSVIDDVDGFLVFTIRGNEITYGGHFADLDEESLKSLFIESANAFAGLTESVWKAKEWE